MLSRTIYKLFSLKVSAPILFLSVLSLVVVFHTAAETRSKSNGSSVCSTAGAYELLAESNGIDRNGAFPNTINYELNDRVLALAHCYSKKSMPLAAEVVTHVLLRYAEVVRHWPVISRNGKLQKEVSFTRWDLGGLWGKWVFLDLRKSAKLARAFELVSSSPSVDEVGRQLGLDSREIIRERLLRYLVDFNLRFGRGRRVGTVTREATFPFHNMDPARLRSLVVFGRVVDPAYIHIAVRLLRFFPRVGFFRDGFWREGTVSYHRQVVNALVALNQDLSGYSDPPGYRHNSYTTLFGDRYLGVPGRFDDLEPIGESARDLRRAKTADRILTLPDGRMLAKNDTHHTDRGKSIHAPSSSTCLFALRHCVLVLKEGRSKTLVHLDYGGTDGHEHLDALHVDFWAEGRLMLGDGAYKGYSPRDWNSSTAAHNTVVVDRSNQDTRWQSRVTLSHHDRIKNLGHTLWQGFGQGDSENAGNLLAADLSGAPVQYVSADAAPAYDSRVQVDNYQRTLILVRGEGGSNYLVDIFDVHGGGRHEWMLHGDLSTNASIRTTLNEKPTNGNIGRYLEVERSAKTEGDWSSDLIYPDGRRLRTFYPARTSTDVLVARAPAQVRAGKANYLLVGKSGPRSTFIAVHVPQRGTPLIKSVAQINPKNARSNCVHLEVEFFSGRSDKLTVFTGKIGTADEECTQGRGRVKHNAIHRSGRCLWQYQGDIPTATKMWHSGEIDVLRQQAGHEINGFKVTQWPTETDAITPSLFHIKLPNGKVETYAVRNLKRHADESALIEIVGEPGLQITPKPATNLSATYTKQLYYPSRGFEQGVMFRTTTNMNLGCGRD